MSLDALAPDQRAVVQLVLQQDRSYDELAGLLGISADAVRERAHRGLERLADPEGLGAAERGEVADYLLGQQSVSGREGTRALLSGSSSARAWARAVSDELRGVARGPLPEIPEPGAGAMDDDLEDDLDGPFEPDPEPATRTVTGTARGGEGIAAPGDRDDDDFGFDDAGEEEPAAAPVRARPRPQRSRPATGRAARGRAAAAASAPAAADAGAEPPVAATPEPPDGGPRRGREDDAPRSNRLGGAILIAGLAILLVAGVIFLVTRGDDEPSTAGNGNGSAAATPTATAESEFQPLGQIPLSAADGGDAEGQMVIFASQSGGVAFTVQATGVPESAEGEAYAVWLLGGNQPRRLGFAPTVGENGEFGTSGPREEDQQRFARWFSRADRVVVSRETSEDASEPGPVVLEGEIPQGEAGAGGAGGGG